MTRLQNAIVARGYVTTRVLVTAAPQALVHARGADTLLACLSSR